MCAVTLLADLDRRLRESDDRERLWVALFGEGCAWQCEGCECGRGRGIVEGMKGLLKGKGPSASCDGDDWDEADSPLVRHRARRGRDPDE